MVPSVLGLFSDINIIKGRKKVSTFSYSFELKAAFGIHGSFWVETLQSLQLECEGAGTTLIESKQGLVMADYMSALSSSPEGKQSKPTSFPRLFTVFTLKSFSDGRSADAAMSPTSILDSKPSSVFRSPFWSDASAPKTPKTPESEAKHRLHSEKIGLGIVDALNDDDSYSKLSKPETRMVLFGSQLRVQIPPLPPSVSSTAASPRTPPEFGTKTRNSQLGSFSSGLSPLSPCPAIKSGFGSENSGMGTLNSPRVFTGCLSATEMELSEEYTCVICRGPNPRTTHIFDNCIVESCEVVGVSGLTKAGGFPGSCSAYQPENFLSCCYTCKKNLGQGKDIYMYRGEKAFCSRECRYQEMMLEEGIDNLEALADDVYGNC